MSLSAPSRLREAATEREFGGLRSEVLERAQALLRKTSHSVLSRIGCDFEQGVLKLEGRLPSFYLKQLAQEAVSDVEGVEEILNQVEVVTPRLPTRGY